MLNYYLSLGVAKLRHNPALTALMIITLAVGVAACVSTMSILQIMSNNPIPHKSQLLISPVIDVEDLNNYKPGDKPADEQMTYRDTVNLLASKQGLRRSAVYGISQAIEPGRPDLPVSDTGGLAVTVDFFTMFEVPMLYGTAWSAQQDEQGADVMVLSRKQSETLFGKINPVGKRLRMAKNEFQIIGVLDDWHPFPRYTHIINGNGGAFSGEDHMFIPFKTAIRLEMRGAGSTRCTQGRGPGFKGLLDSECTWIQFWFELENQAQLRTLNDYLHNYVAEQKKLKRIPRPDAVKVYDVMAWLEYLKVVQSDNKLAVWLAFGFLSLCLVNTVGLLLAKFSTRSAEVGVRRALGASRSDIFKQFLSETLIIGVVGAGCGIPLSLAAIYWLGKFSFKDAVVPDIDWFILSATILLSIGASALAGLLPIWRASQTTPALQLKSQ
jgi:putative ABC transport system permease protein